MQRSEGKQGSQECADQGKLQQGDFDKPASVTDRYTGVRTNQRRTATSLMNIQQLETFYWITRLGTFGAAGEHLHTSQATVSSRIRELENELDVMLFDRIGRNVVLTIKGRELLAHAEKVVVDAARLRMAAGTLRVEQGVVRIGIVEMIAMSFLTPIINQLEQRYPGVEVEFDVNLNASLLGKLTRGAIDIAVIGGPVEDIETKFVPVGSMDLVWVGTPEILRDLPDYVRPAEIAGLPIISLNRESRTFSVMHAWFAKEIVTPRRVNYCNSLLMMLNIVREGICVCMMPLELVSEDLKSGILRALKPDPMLHPVGFFVATRAESIDPVIADIAKMIARLVQLPAAPEDR